VPESNNFGIKKKKQESCRKVILTRTSLKRKIKEGIITGIATANHEDTRGSRDITTNKGAKRRVMLVPIEALSFLDVSRGPVQGVSIVVSVAARHVPVHLLRFAISVWTRRSKQLLWLCWC
jgi:hypothetical protein